MRTQLLFRTPTTPLLIGLLAVTASCTQSTSPVAAEKKPEATPGVVAAAAPQPAIETGKNGPNVATGPGHKVTTVKLPAPIDDFCIGAGGKRMVVRLQDLGKLVVLDMCEGKSLGYVSLDDPEDFFAAGLDKLIVVGRKSRMMKRYSLVNLKQEAVQPLSGELPVTAVGMGTSSHGPLYIVRSSANSTRAFAVNPETLQMSECTMQFSAGRSSADARWVHMNVSADGSTFCVWNEKHTGEAILMASGTTDRMECHTIYTSRSFFCPDDIGQRIYTGSMVDPFPGEPTGVDNRPKGVQAIPAIGGPYYLTVPPEQVLDNIRRGVNQRNQGSQAAESFVQVYLVGESKPVAALPVTDFPILEDANASERAGALCRWLIFLPHAKMIAELPATRDFVTLHRLDMKEELRRTFSDELVVVSRPPRMVRAGETLRYPIETLSKDGKPAFKLDTGPDGMTVSKDGVVEWTPASTLVSSRVGAIISIRDSGHSKLHTIALKVQPPADIAARAADGPPRDVLAGGKPAGDIRLKLPAKCEGVRVGGNGRFLVLSFPSQKKLAVFDVSAAKIIGDIPVVGECLFAAGMDKLVVFSTERGKIDRYDLQTQKPEASQTVSLQGEARLIAMGHASHGPVLIGAANSSFFVQLLMLNLDTLRPRECHMPDVDAWRTPSNRTSRLIASDDGRQFGITGGGNSRILTLDGKEVTYRDAQAPDRMTPDNICIQLFGKSNICAGRSQQPPSLGPPHVLHERDVAAVGGPLVLRLRDDEWSSEQPSLGVSASIWLPDDEKPLATLRDLPLPENMLIPTRYEGIPADERVWLIPDFKVIALLPDGQDTIVLRRFDLDEELKRSHADYLAVVSRPPQSILHGQTFQYQIDVRSAAGKVKYHLDFGPKGMQVSTTGLVRCDTKELQPRSKTEVRIMVADGLGHRVRHRFELTVDDKADPVEDWSHTSSVGLNIPVAATPGNGSPQAEWRISKADDHRLRIPKGDIVLSPGLHYKSMLLLQGEHLALLAPNGVAILKTQSLMAAYGRIAERPDYYVAIASNPPVIDLLEKTTMLTIRRIPYESNEPDEKTVIEGNVTTTTRRLSGERGRPVDLAIHPTRPISYVAVLPMGKSTNGFFVVVDEKSGDIRESKEYIGRWLGIDAAGQRLVTAALDQGTSGPKIMYMPRPGAAPSRGPVYFRGVPVPLTPGVPGPIPGLTVHWSKDLVAVYELTDDGTPILSDASVRDSGNNAGLWMAPDGLRATCALKSGNSTTGMDLDALNGKPIEYATGGARSLDFAYHPVLPFVACLRPNGPMLFDRETGKPEPRALKDPMAADLKDATFHHLWFSADGKGLLLDMDAPSGDRYLYRAELNLSPDELDKVGKRLANMASLGRNLLVDGEAEAGHGTVPLAEIDAFKGGRGEEMSAKELGRSYTNAVVVVRSGQRSGTGAIVGASGYILTCAHNVREADGISVSYRSATGDDAVMKTVPANVVRADHGNDLALLKIEGVSGLPAVRLGIGETVESGERATIISNPGVGQTVLDYTMTEGLISNTRRKLGHQVLLQTSAAVNPGSSGAPLFNSKGLVIGLVVLKANIEAAGFAVPVGKLGAFLATTVKATDSEGAIERQWFDVGYKHPTVAKYLGVRNGAVQLRRTDGREITVPLNKLSPQDLAFVRLFDGK